MTGFAKRAAVAPRLLAKPVIGNSSRSEEHTSEPSHDQISYAVFCLKKKKEFYFLFCAPAPADSHRATAHRSDDRKPPVSGMTQIQSWLALLDLICAENISDSARKPRQ